ncbi:MAG: squalene/phytoene synthase family protein [Verrucomicrobiota bacterium JB023]|nr:squalene/phytoene synthase family protein [Verrucomicrobiota bacterium JB023]
MTEAQNITRKAKSNLAFALLSLPKENRDDVTIFYAFCRQIDDLADDPDLPEDEKIEGLKRWKQLFTDGLEGSSELESEVLRIKEKHNIPAERFVNLIEGCEMDLVPQRFETWEDLQGYTYRVASTVGLICLPLFGSKDPEAEKYAVTLGHALQLTNIMRDVGEDLDNGERIYLPIADLKRFNYSEADLENRVYDERFREMMAFQAERANRLFAEARELVPSGDRRNLVAAEMMRSLYHVLLEKMMADDFKVFHQRYRLAKWRKVLTLVLHFLRSRISD